MSEPHWRVYIVGPDEYHPAGSRRDAMNVASAINAFALTLPDSAPFVWAVPELQREAES